MDEAFIKLMTDLHLRNNRQGPGGDAQTALAIQLAGLDPSKALSIADIGCGTGSSSLLLAHHLQAQITAVDFLPPFLEQLRARALATGLADRITPLCALMEALPFTDNQFDVIWSEGAIYNMGFVAGIRAWRPFLKPGGQLVVSEITWLTEARPAEIQAHWDAAYPEISTASGKFKALEDAGYSPEAYFTLPVECWSTHYYEPLKKGLPSFLERHRDNPTAQEIAEAELQEMALHQQYHSFFSYGVYIARKHD
jgi:ubiquinone/menaquinone biosynthesis C-methylase UbiE